MIGESVIQVINNHVPIDFIPVVRSSSVDQTLGFGEHGGLDLKSGDIHLSNKDYPPRSGVLNKTGFPGIVFPSEEVEAAFFSQIDIRYLGAFSVGRLASFGGSRVAIIKQGSIPEILANLESKIESANPLGEHSKLLTLMIEILTNLSKATAPPLISFRDNERNQLLVSLRDKVWDYLSSSFDVLPEEKYMVLIHETAHMQQYARLKLSPKVWRAILNDQDFKALRGKRSRLNEEEQRIVNVIFASSVLSEAIAISHELLVSYDLNQPSFQDTTKNRVARRVAELLSHYDNLHRVAEIGYSADCGVEPDRHSTKLEELKDISLFRHLQSTAFISKENGVCVGLLTIHDIGLIALLLATEDELKKYEDSRNPGDLISGSSIAEKDTELLQRLLQLFEKSNAEVVTLIQSRYDTLLRMHRNAVVAVVETATANVTSRSRSESP